MASRKQKNELAKQARKKKLIQLCFITVSAFVFFITVLFFLEYHTKKTIQSSNTSEVKLRMKKLPKEFAKKVEKTATSSATIRIPILVYHYVEIVKDKKDTIRKSLSTPPYVLEKQIETLKNAGYTFITPSDIAAMVNGEKNVPKKSIVISFDDGYGDFYTDVFPILQKENVKSVAYIVPGFLDKSNYMTTEQLDTVYKSGLVEIGAHTMHHMYLKNAAATIVEKEITDSKTWLDTHFHTHTVSFAYPYGAFDQQSIDILQKVGFTTAVSEIGGNDVTWANRYFLYRLHPGYGSGPGLLQTIEHIYPTKY